MASNNNKDKISSSSSSGSIESGYGSGGSSRSRRIEEGQELLISYFTDELKSFLDTEPEQQNEFMKSFVDRNSKRKKYLSQNDFILGHQKMQTTNVRNNEGAIFLLFSNSCLSKECLEKLIKFYNLEAEQKMAARDFLLRYKDPNSKSTVLHKLANAIVKRHDRNQTVTKDHWSAFDYVLKTAPELNNQVDSWGRTPEDIIKEETYLSLEEHESFAETANENSTFGSKISFDLLGNSCAVFSRYKNLELEDTEYSRKIAEKIGIRIEQLLNLINSGNYELKNQAEGFIENSEFVRIAYDQTEKQSDYIIESFADVFKLL